MSQKKRSLDLGDLIKKKHPDNQRETKYPGMIYLGPGKEPGTARFLAVGLVVLMTVEVPLEAVETMESVKRNYIQIVEAEEGDEPGCD